MTYVESASKIVEMKFVINAESTADESNAGCGSSRAKICKSVQVYRAWMGQKVLHVQVGEDMCEEGVDWAKWLKRPATHLKNSFVKHTDVLQKT